MLMVRIIVRPEGRTRIRLLTFNMVDKDFMMRKMYSYELLY